MENKNSAWFNENHLPQEMVNGALGLNGWGRLESSEHFKTLDSLIKLSNGLKIADIGCGAAELGRIYSNYEYAGYDLPHIIEKVAKVVNPNLNYESFDADTFDYSKFSNHDILICNGFISELLNPLEILVKILEHTNNVLIIHRQFFKNSDEIISYTTYAGLPTPRCHISLENFKKILKSHKIIEHMSAEYGDSLLIKKIS
jgi:hypothetical protein